MQELEKILEEIEIRAIKDLEEENDRCSTTCKGCCSDVKERKCNCRDAIIVRAFERLAKCMNDGWISVEERLPEESLNSVIGWDEYRERCCFVQYYAGKWALRADREPIKITHWRPIPDRPADKTEAPDWRESMLRKFDRRE